MGRLRQLGFKRIGILGNAGFTKERDWILVFQNFNFPNHFLLGICKIILGW